MLPTGMPSSALILAYATGGSWISACAISRWQSGGQAHERLAQRCVTLRQKQLMVRRPRPRSSLRTVLRHLPGEPGTVRSPRGAQHLRPHSRRVVVASQPGSAARSPDFVKLLQPAAARRSGQRRRRRCRPARTGGRWTKAAGRTARPVRPTPACRHPSARVIRSMTTGHHASGGRPFAQDTWGRGWSGRRAVAALGNVPSQQVTCTGWPQHQAPNRSGGGRPARQPRGPGRCARCPQEGRQG